MTIAPNSRYADADNEFSTSHSYDVAGVPRKDPDDPKKSRVHNRDTLYRVTTQPDVLVLPRYNVMRETDTWPLVAYKHLRDPQKWWQLAEDNPHIHHPFDVKMGDRVHIRQE